MFVRKSLLPILVQGTVANNPLLTLPTLSMTQREPRSTPRSLRGRLRKREGKGAIIRQRKSRARSAIFSFRSELVSSPTPSSRLPRGLVRRVI